MNLNAKPEVVASGFEFCEGPAFGPDGNLYLVNLRGGYVSRVSMEGRVTRFADTPGPNGAQFDAAGRYIVCEMRGKAIVAFDETGAAQTIADACDGRAFNGPNDIAIDADGGCYFTDPEGSHLDNRIGSIYHIRPDKTVVRIDDGLAYPNGINISADRSQVIVAETLTHRLYHYKRNADGTLGDRQLFCRLEAGGVGPDGMAFDRDGNLYVAHYGIGCVHVIDLEGKLIGRLDTPGENPTNCCFGPPDSPWETHLFVTETATNTLYRYDLGVPGMPLLHLA
jgi:gluconolactonase